MSDPFNREPMLTCSQLALYVAQRGVVVFRDQDFVDQAPEWQLDEWGK